MTPPDSLAGTPYAIAHGFVGYATDPSNYTYWSLWDTLPNPIAKHIEISGWGGWGMDFGRMINLWPLLVFAFLWHRVRAALRPVFRSTGIALGIPAQSKTKLQKFVYQCWLLTFYVLSTIFGAYVLRDKPWTGFPMTPENQMHLIINHPHVPDMWMVGYYCYQLGFFVAELFVIFQETRRSDFVEYVAHHIVTILLMVFSFIGYETRIGSYILLLHDISDIFLCLTKLLHYLKVNDLVVNVSFAVFVVAFFYTRLLCLPIHGFAVLFVAPLKRMCTVNFWLLALLLQVVLQGLHVYWFVLIVRLIGRLVFSTQRGDIRSDSDEEPAPSEKKKK